MPPPEMIAAIMRIGFALIAAPSGNTIGATTALMPQREPVVNVSAATRTKAIAGKTGPQRSGFATEIIKSVIPIPSVTF